MENTYEFTHVPTLRELLPQTAGIPGVKYAQVCAANAKIAQDEGWGPVHGAKLFTINGSKGSSDMLLACTGNPIPGASPHSGARVMVLDHDIYRLTGEWLGELPEELMEDAPVKKPAKKVSDKASLEKAIAAVQPKEF